MSAFSNDNAGRTSSRVAGDRGSLDQIGAGSRTPKKSPSTEQTKPEVIGVSAEPRTHREAAKKKGAAMRKTAPTGRWRGGDGERPVIRIIHFGRNRSGARASGSRAATMPAAPRTRLECPTRLDVRPSLGVPGSGTLASGRFRRS
jgi:hypothetical protein